MSFGGCPSFRPNTIADLIEEQNHGLVLGEYELQIVRFRNLDDQKIAMFRSLGGLVEKSTEIPNVRRNSQKRKYADDLFQDEEKEEIEDTRPMKISALSWHPFKPRLAVAVREYGIYFYDQSNEIWENEPYADMGPINDIEFGPLGSCIAAACEDGIYIWRARQQPRGDFPESDISSLHKSFFKFRGAQGVRFSRCGRHLCGWTKGVVRIFSASDMSDSVKLHSTFSTIKDCDFHDCGLLVSSDKAFNLYNCDTWQYKAYSSVRPVVTGIAGFPSSMYLFATDQYLQWLMLKDDQEEIGMAFDLSIPGAHADDMRSKQVSLSPCASRVAVVYHVSDCPLSRSVAIISVEKTMLVPVGFIHGQEDWGEALQCTFRSLRRGTMLTIFWASGTISFHHLLH